MITGMHAVIYSRDPDLYEPRHARAHGAAYCIWTGARGQQ
jgi:hypothetical protein